MGDRKKKHKNFSIESWKAIGEFRPLFLTKEILINGKYRSRFQIFSHVKKEKRKFSITGILFSCAKASS